MIGSFLQQMSREHRASHLYADAGIDIGRLRTATM